MDDDMVMYSCSQAPFINVKLAGKKFQAKDGVLRLPKDAADELDALKKGGRNDLAILQKIDLDAAVATAKAHQAKQRTAAIHGTMNSKHAVNQPGVAETDAAHLSQPIVPGTNEVKTVDGITGTGEPPAPAAKAGFAARTKT